MYIDNRIESITIDADAHTVAYKPVIDPDTFGKGGITDHAALKACIQEMIVEDGLQLTDETILTISGALENIAALGNIMECLGR